MIINSVTSANDYANQGILTKVRAVDPDGQRTLGIITKPDRLDAGSDGEKAFINLAQNIDIFFKLGWHVLKNRKYEEKDCSFEERNGSEARFFSTSNFKVLSKETVGITSLRSRLSQLLFAHIKHELPKLQRDLTGSLGQTREALSLLGTSRTTAQECRSFLTHLSQNCYNISKAAVDGHYEHEYFAKDAPRSLPVVGQPSSRLILPIRRLRAKIQNHNEAFNTHFRRNGHAYQIINSAHEDDSDGAPGHDYGNEVSPKIMTREAALKWVKDALTQNRGRELSGNFNPLVVGELFWAQSTKWESFAKEHVELVAETCTDFLTQLFEEKCPEDVRIRLWGSQIEDALKTREQQALLELDRIMEDVKSYPINYNHYYTDIVKKGRQKRELAALTALLKDSQLEGDDGDGQPCSVGKSHRSPLPAPLDLSRIIEHFTSNPHPDIERHSCEEALDCLLAIYKVHQKTFVANIVTQVIERHIVRGLENIFSPVVVDTLTEEDVAGLASEPAISKRERNRLSEDLTKLEEGRRVLRRALRVAV